MSERSEGRLATRCRRLGRCRAMRFSALLAVVAAAAFVGLSCGPSEEEVQAEQERAEFALRRLSPPASALPGTCAFVDPSDAAWPYAVAKNPYVSTDLEAVEALAARHPAALEPKQIVAVMWSYHRDGADLGIEAAWFWDAADAADAEKHLANELPSDGTAHVLVKGKVLVFLWHQRGAAERSVKALQADASKMLSELEMNNKEE